LILSSILWNDWLKLYSPKILKKEKSIDRFKPLKEGDLKIKHATKTITLKLIITEFENSNIKSSR